MLEKVEVEQVGWQPLCFCISVHLSSLDVGGSCMGRSKEFQETEYGISLGGGNYLYYQTYPGIVA